ncbi:MAG: hypothetical protein PHR75_06420 [Sulfurovum sp.]|nr:hypothetical protein [Sulfurovum sp.]
MAASESGMLASIEEEALYFPPLRLEYGSLGSYSGEICYEDEHNRSEPR